MSDQNDLENKDKNLPEDDKELEGKKGTIAEEHQALIAALVDEQLSGIKSKLDLVYKQRDEAVKEAAALKAKTQEFEQKRLRDEGKHLEASQLRIAELEESKRQLEERLTLSSRDRELESALSGVEFRNDVARGMAFKEIIPQLVQDEDGVWVHKSGASIKDYIKTFTKDPNQEFLFKPKQNSGTGSTPGGKTGLDIKGRPEKLKGLSTAQLLELAASKKLGEFGY